MLTMTVVIVTVTNGQLFSQVSLFQAKLIQGELGDIFLPLGTFFGYLMPG